MKRLAIVSAVLGFQLTTFAQGPLTPPGTPAPTMKTLDQVEPRTAITNLPYTISQPGSYYLTTNLSGVAGQHGILISADNVTVDLKGFDLVGVPGSVSGIARSSSDKNLAVRNGTIRDWGAHGIDCSFFLNSQLEDLRVSGNAHEGIRIGDGASVQKCVLRGNGGYGITVSGGASIFGCIALSNGSDGFVQSKGTIAHCLASGNSGGGISVSTDCVVKDCVAAANSGTGIRTGDNCTVTSCSANSNANGIRAASGCSIKDSQAENNSGEGIQVSQGCSVINNNANNNGNTGSAGTQGGIHVTGNGNRIDSNHTVSNNCDGVLVDGSATKNFVVRNTSGQNAGFQIRVPGLPGQPPANANIVGAVVNDATNANANAWANFQQF